MRLRKAYLITILILIALLAACNRHQEPIKVFITTTPQAEPSANAASFNKQGAFPGPSATPSEAPTEQGATQEPSPSAPSTASSTPSATPSPTPSQIPNEPSLLDSVPPPEQLPMLNPNAMGLQIHPNITEEDWRNMIGEAQRLGVEWLKLQIPWNLLEPAPGQYNELYSSYVLRVQNANVNGFKVLLSFVDAPDWARPEGFRPGYNGPPADPQQLANFIAAFLTATKPEDRRIAAIEVWNEPNLRDREWDGVALDGATYMRYFTAAYDTIKSIDPNITVITAGLAPVGDLPGAVSDRRFLQQMYDAGLANYADARIGVHPYGWANAPDERCCIEGRPWGDNRVFFFQDTLYDYIEIMQNNGHNSKLWLTEFGWGTYQGVGENGADVAPVPESAAFFEFITLEEQATYAIRAFEIVQQPPLSDWIEVSVLWNLNFAALPLVVDQRLEQAGYSIFNASSQPRLIYYYLLRSRRTG